MLRDTATETASSPADAASAAPLRLDAEVLRRADAASRGLVQQLARSAGQSLVKSPQAIPAGALLTDVANSGKPDCLAPNPNGSLLSLPLIMVSALSGACQ